MQLVGRRDLPLAGREDVLDAAAPPRAGSRELGQGFAGAELEHAEARKPAGKRSELERCASLGAAVAASSRCLLEDAVGIADERALAAAGQGGGVAAAENGARGGSRVLEGAREIDIFRRNEALELATQRLGHRFRVGLQQDRHAFVLALDW